MTVKRQYNLPNCSLILEGLEDSSQESADILSGQPPMSILVNAECQFVDSAATLSGGSIFLENLAQAVSNYTQGLLSGLPHPEVAQTEYPQIHLKVSEDKHLHHLTLEPEPNGKEEKVTLDLTTVQLFDLVDAIDRLMADRSTLPHLNIPLAPLSKRHRKPEQPLTERVTPMLIGASSLALVAAMLWMIPIPEVKPPEVESESVPAETIPTTPTPATPGVDPEPETEN